MAFAIVAHAGKQYRVEEGQIVQWERLKGEPGSEVILDKVLLLGEGSSLHVGKPWVQGARVKAEILEHVKGPKVIAFKYRRREGYHRTVGHRQPHTRLRIVAIENGVL
ncbi:50S ribosomal protein L21 [Candidatus Methylacidithermus pantelleriae]|nr:50S ribosomal protein L21 [Candidatus Methylacidithermus pantelleriae]